MISYSSNYKSILANFQRHNIPTELPGFYNHHNFLNLEIMNSEYLLNYCRFVNTKNYTEDYLNRARIEIPVIVEILYNELIKDGRIGACVDISMGLSKILEKEGYWNYIAAGSLILNFPQDSGINPLYFWHINNSDTSAAHAWVVAPPFTVIDISLKQQAYPQNVLDYLPSYVITDKYSTCKVDVNDIIAPEVQEELRLQKIKPKQMIASIDSDFSEKLRIFPPHIEMYNEMNIKYITCKGAAPDEELENIKSLCLNGLYSSDIYHRKIRPRLEELRKTDEN